jgi:hypothetical protein
MHALAAETCTWQILYFQAVFNREEHGLQPLCAQAMLHRTVPGCLMLVVDGSSIQGIMGTESMRRHESRQNTTSIAWLLMDLHSTAPQAALMPGHALALLSRRTAMCPEQP